MDTGSGHSSTGSAIVWLPSTLHALVSALHLWTTSLDKGQAVRTVFVDFRKAFDLVDHNILLKKITPKVGSQIIM